MSGVNPVVLIQMLMRYDAMKGEDRYQPRTFTFTRNNRMRVHKETEEEAKKRKSYLNTPVLSIASDRVRKLACQSLHGRIDKQIYVDPAMKKIAVPLETSTGSSGFGVMTTGSRIPIPEGKFVRAFTYWEKVNDIDLSCFGINSDGEHIEFSWRTMCGLQSDAITYSGDQTSGFDGGSEYFDINLDEFRKQYPKVRYIMFCNNVYSDSTFKNCFCKAGFMIREFDTGDPVFWKGEVGIDRCKSDVAPVIFDPKTVQTSFRIDSDSSFAYLFAIDIGRREMVWLNVARSGRHAVAGSTEMDWLEKYMHATDVFNAYDFWTNVGKTAPNPVHAEIAVGDFFDEEVLKDFGVEIIHSWDFEKMLAVLGQRPA